jgi:glycosyltransferase involved in cell wall biosynthesis
MAKIDYSVIIPFFNEEENLPTLHKELIEVLSKLNIKSEIVYINDGSTDNSLELLGKEIRTEKDGQIQIKLVSLKRNFGQTAAISAGIDNSEGELISFLDADMQNDPKDLPGFLEKMSGGYDAVFGWRKERKDTSLRSFFSRIANKLINIIFNYPFHDVGCSARIVKREYLQNLNLYGELHRVLPVLIYLKGAKIAELVVNHRERLKGKSKYGFERIVKTIIDIITVKFLSSFGTKPAYIFGTFGMGSILLTGILSIVVIYNKLILGVFVYKQPLFLVAIFLGIVGVQFILMGLLAELQVRTYFESQHKTIYEIKETLKY